MGQAFAELFSELEITEAEQDKAKAQQQRVRDKLDDLLEVIATYLSGSYRLRTLIRPLDDIDLLALLAWEAYRDKIALDATGATKVLDILEAAIAKAYPKTERRRFSRCIQVQFAGTGIGFDIVPVFQFAGS